MRGERVRTILHTESSPGWGGQEVRILTEARWLVEHGWQVQLACQPASGILSRAQGIRVHPIRMRGPWDPSAFVRLVRLIRRERIALVHTHSSVDSWIATLAARALGRPVVRSRHVSIPISARRALVYHLADRIIASGEAVAQLVRAAGVPPAKIVSIPAGVDTREFHPGVSGRPVREELGLTGPVVGIVAMLRSSKGHRFFLEAAREVLQALPETRFLIVGDGVGYEDTRRHVRELGLEHAVTLTGFRNDIPAVMAALDVLVLPSIKSEATSQVIPQAFAVGTPVVAAATGGIPEIIRDGATGLLVPPRHSGALAAAIRSVLTDRATARRMAEAGRRLVLEHYSLDRMMERTVAVYCSLLS